MWYDGWLSGKSSFPVPDVSDVESVFKEVECADHGADWTVLNDGDASNGSYAMTKPGLNITNAAPTGSESLLKIPFTTGENSTY
jgi:hypothetical protein